MTQFRIAIFTLVVAAIGVLSLPDAYAYKLKCRSQQNTSPYTVRSFPGYDHDRFGTLPRQIFKEFGAYVSSFDSDDDDNGDGTPDLRANPEWVTYEIKRYRDDGAGNFTNPNPSIDRPTWYEHPDLAFLNQQAGVTAQNLDDSYSGIGTVWNRGHLAMSAHALRLGWQQACNTHFFLNAVPQQADFNQGDWLDLEAFAGAAANKFGSVWVITGPIFRTGTPIQTIGDPGEIPIAIPHALFKILIKEPAGGGLPDVLAFIYEQPLTTYRRCGSAANVPPYDHVGKLVSVSNIEQQTGLTFFNNLHRTTAQLQAFKSQTATSLWVVEDRFYGIKCRT